MTERPATRLARILRAENAHLADGDIAAAMRLLPEKEQAAAALRNELPHAQPDRELAGTLQALTTENAALLRDAITVQARIVEMVARAARRAGPAQAYGARGAPASPIGALALTLRA